MIGATGESVAKFEVTSFYEKRNTFRCFLRISHKPRILQKSPSFIECSPLDYASNGCLFKSIGTTGESVEKFDLTSFFEKRNTFLGLLRISHKGRILQKNSPLYKMFAIKLRVERLYFVKDRSTGESVEQFKVT